MEAATTSPRKTGAKRRVYAKKGKSHEDAWKLRKHAAVPHECGPGISIRKITTVECLTTLNAQEGPTASKQKRSAWNSAYQQQNQQNKKRSAVRTQFPAGGGAGSKRRSGILMFKQTPVVILRTRNVQKAPTDFQLSRLAWSDAAIRAAKGAKMESHIITRMERHPVEQSPSRLITAAATLEYGNNKSSSYAKENVKCHRLPAFFPTAKVCSIEALV